MKERHQYYMNIAIAVRQDAKCLGRRVGAILVRESHIISTGYNGTPSGVKNCTDGGCVRCKNKKDFQDSVGYDVCVCVHAEQNALISAARFGNAIEGATAYSTMQPCFSCLKSLLQAKIRNIYYLHPWNHPDKRLDEQYQELVKYFDEVKQIECDDPQADWANNISAK
jgi:dCMP deaminase